LASLIKVQNPIHLNRRFMLNLLIELIYLAEGMEKEDITNLSDLPVHFQF